MTFGIPVAGNYTVGYGYIPGVHLALDFEVPVGTPVLAIAPGTVTKTGDEGALGDTIEVTHTGGYKSKYGNLTTYAVPVGTKVGEGTQLGTSGGAVGSKDAGDSTGPHLPLQIWLNGVAVNPAPLVGITPGASTGPTVETAAYNPLDPLGIIPGDTSALATAEGTIFNRTFWLRVCAGIAGGILLLIVLLRLASQTNAGQQVIKTTKSTAKDAAEVAIVAPK